MQSSWSLTGAERRTTGYWLEALVLCCLGLSIGMLTWLASPGASDQQKCDKDGNRNVFKNLVLKLTFCCFFIGHTDQSWHSTEEEWIHRAQIPGGGGGHLGGWLLQWLGNSRKSLIYNIQIRKERNREGKGELLHITSLFLGGKYCSGSSPINFYISLAWRG